MEIDDLKKFLMEQRNLHERERWLISKSLDKYLITLITGSLYLSVLFLQNFSDGLRFAYVLYTSWIFLIFSLFFVFVSIHYSQKMFEEQVGDIDKYLIAIDNNLPKPFSDDKVNKISGKVDLLNWLGLSLCFFGITTLMLFCFINL